MVFAPVAFTGRTLSPAMQQVHGMVDGWPYGYEGRTPETTFNVDLPTAAWYEWPVNRTVARAYLGGELPLWNPYQAAGTPLAADYSTRAFFPYQVLEDISPYALTDLFLIGRAVIAGLLTFLFASVLGLSFPAAVAAGALYMLSGPFTWFLNLEQLSNVAMMVPGLMFAAELAVRARRMRESAVLGVAIALTIVAGQPEAALYALALAAGFFLLRSAGLLRVSRPEFVRALGLGCVSLVLGLLLSAPLTLPFLELVEHGFTLHRGGAGAGVEFVSNWRKAVGILTPSALGMPASPSLLPGVLDMYGDGSYYRVFATKGSWDYLGGYTGTISVFLALSGVIAAARGRAEYLRPVVFFFVVAGAVILLKNFGVRPFLWIGELPGFERAWSPRWAGPAWVFSLSMAAGLGLETVATRAGGSERAKRGLSDEVAFVIVAAVFAFVVAPLAVGAVLAGHHLGPEAGPFVFPVVVVGTVVPAVLLVAALVVLRTTSDGGRAVWAVGLLAALELWWCAPRGYAPAAIYAMLVPLAVSIVAVAFSASALRRASVAAGVVFLLASLAVDFSATSGLASRHNAFAEPPYVEFLRQRSEGPAGVDEAGLYRVAGGYGVLMPNYAGAAGLADLRHINALLAPGWRDFRYTRLESPPEGAETIGSALWFTGLPKHIVVRNDPDRGIYFDTKEHGIELDIEDHLPWYSVMGVRYIIMPSWFGRRGEGAGWTAHSGLRLVYDDEVRIYENPGAMPRAFVIYPSDDAGSLSDYATGALRAGVVPAAVTEYGFNRVTVEADAGGGEKTGALLVLTDVVYPGWEATVDGEAAKIVTVEGVLRGVFLGAGAHVVEFRYRPASVRAGLWAFAAGGLIVLAAVVPPGALGYNRKKFNEKGRR